MIFLCPDTKDFQNSFDKCNQCSMKDKCLNYEYEFNYQEKIIKKQKEEEEIGGVE